MRPATRYAFQTLLAILGFLLALGSDVHLVFGNSILWPVASLFVFGNGLRFALRSDIRVSPVLTVLALFLAGVIVSFGEGSLSAKITIFVGAGIVVTVLGLLLSGIEFSLRNPKLIRRQISPVALRVAIFVGGIHGLVLISIRGLLNYLNTGVLFPFLVIHSTWPLRMTIIGILTGLFFLFWMVLGSFLLAAVPAYLLVQSRLVLPIGLIIPVSVYVATQTVLVGGRNTLGALGTPLLFYLVIWIVPLMGVLLIGLAEYLFRVWLGIFPPRPIQSDSIK